MFKFQVFCSLKLFKEKKVYELTQNLTCVLKT